MLNPASLKEEIRAEAGRLGFVHCGFARADAVPLVFHSFATKPREAPTKERPVGLVEPLVVSHRTNAPDSLLAEFSSDPHPFVSTAQPNEFCVQSIDESAGAGHGPIDLMFATRTMIAHPTLEQPPLEEAWALVQRVFDGR